MQFEIHPGASSQFYWRIVAANGRVLAHSENYFNKQDAIDAVNLVKANAEAAPFYDYTQ